MVKKAKELEMEGAKIVSADCGFYVYFQDAMTEGLSIPVCTSALLVVPLVSRLIGRKKRVGIITWNSRALSKAHLRQAGIDESVKIAVVGYEKWAEKRSPMFHADASLLPEKRLEMLEEDLVSASKELIKKHPDVGAIVLECTAFPPAAYAVQRATCLPVFDIVMLLNWIGDAVVRKRCPPVPTL
jgi:Asp/Glu/hydantoin racemase